MARVRPVITKRASGTILNVASPQNFSCTLRYALDLTARKNTNHKKVKST